MSALAGLAARGALRSLGFATAPALDLPRSVLPELEAVAADLEEPGVTTLVPPEGLGALDLLRWLVGARPVLFHGSGRDDLGELSPERQSRDATAFGDQRAVYATHDAIWATFFAVLDRSRPEFTSTRNAVSAVVTDGRVSPARYFFAVNDDAVGPDMWRAGTVYVFGREGFVAEPRDMGVIDTAQWVSVAPVRPLARVAVTPEDFPFATATFGYRPGEPIHRTYLRARRAARRV